MLQSHVNRFARASATIEGIGDDLGSELRIEAQNEFLVASGDGDERPQWLDDWKRWPRLTAVERGNLYAVPAQLIQRPTPRVLDGAERLCAALEDARRKRPR